ncbi:hypothetical protein YH62_16845 [Rhizobium sp. LC145]|nr:hypothetical protein YH62_16845 [Rhizobium sp. LC145]
MIMQIGNSARPATNIRAIIHRRRKGEDADCANAAAASLITKCRFLPWMIVAFMIVIDRYSLFRRAQLTSGMGSRRTEKNSEGEQRCAHSPNQYFLLAQRHGVQLIFALWPS